MQDLAIERQKYKLVFMSKIDKNKIGKKVATVVGKTLKVTFIVLITIILLVGISVGTALYLVFTPEKTTKIVNHYANELLNADVNFRNIDITFLSTYPNFYLTINDGNIVSKAFEQTSLAFPTAKDSLLSFSACRIKLDPIKYLSSKDLEIDTVYFDNIQAFVFTSEDGKANWEVFPPSEEDTTSTDFVLEDYISSVAIGNITVTSGKINYEDYASKVFANINKTNLELNGNFLDPNATLNFHIRLEKINLKTDSVVLAKDVTIDFGTKFYANIDSTNIDLSKASLAINDIEFDMDGYVAMPDTSNIVIDAHLQASVPAIDMAKKMVPAAMLPIVNTMDATGSLNIDATLKGNYNQASYPTVLTSIVLKDASFKHEMIDFWINNIQLDATAFVDLNNNVPSYAKINTFSLDNTFATLKTKAQIHNLLKDPLVNASLATNVNIGRALQFFPVVEGMDISGKSNVDISINTALSSITNQQWEKVNASAMIMLKEMAVDSPKDTMHIAFPKAKINLKTNDINQQLYSDKYLVDADIAIDNLDLAYTTLAKGKIPTVNLHLLLSPEYSSKTITALANVNLGNAALALMETMGYRSKETSLQISMHPNAMAKQSPDLRCSIKTKQSFLNTDSIEVDLKNMEMDIALKPIHLCTNNDTAFHYRNLSTEETLNYIMNTMSDSTQPANTNMLQTIFDKWKIDVNLGVNGTTARLKMLNYPITSPSVKLSYENNTLALKTFIAEAKNSDIIMHGKIMNLKDALLGKDKFKGNIDLRSNNLNINELMSAMATTETTTNADSLTATTDTVVPMSVIEVPNNINITLSTDIKHAIYGKANFKNINGEIILKNQSILLNNLNFASDLGSMNTTLLYKAIDKSKADFSAELKIDKLNIHTLTTQLPEVDSMLPMLRSFEGLISTDIIATGEFDSTLGINMPSLVASCYLRGDSLVLLDNKTFQKFSKILLFKNKERNLIDSLAVEILIRQQTISFMPFILQMDRYRVGVMGTQFMNMDFDYNVSVLKWPLGVNLFVKYNGNMDDIDNAKLKIKLGEKQYSKEYEHIGKSSSIRKQWKNIIIQKRKDLLEE